MAQDPWLHAALVEMAIDAGLIGTDLIVATAGQAPVIGVLIQALEARNHRAYRERIEQALTWLEKKIDEARDDVNRDFLKTRQFASLLEVTLNEIGNTRDEEHREYLRSFLFGATRQQNPDPYKARRILRLLEYLEPVQVKVLYVLREWQDSSSPIVFLLSEVTDLSRDEAIEQLQEMRRLGLYNSRTERRGALLVPVIDDVGERVWDDRELTPRALELLDFLANKQP